MDDGTMDLFDVDFIERYLFILEDIIDDATMNLFDVDFIERYLFI